MLASAPEGLYPRRYRVEELTEAPKNIGWQKIPETVDDIPVSRKIRNEFLPVVLQSEAFDLGFSEPDIRTNRRLDIF